MPWTATRAICRNQTLCYWCCYIPGRIDGTDPNDQIVPNTPTPAPDCNGKSSSCLCYCGLLDLSVDK
ncbi:hypothetical protein BTUL_0046g00300 [Botrytis tulipae]|uniref:Uncharacterized protein n=1 Tax=Botrytis tulipae TaxID=87230 RepID=A0A4Z1F0F9_9HELO|nr:hypothetical protein BTUL_0046g00300 [Botrytis tulipae]